MIKEYGRRKVSSIQVLIFVYVCVVTFLTSIFFLTKTLRILKKTMPFKLNAIYTELYSKEYYFEETFTLDIAFDYVHIYILFHLLLRTKST